MRGSAFKTKPKPSWSSHHLGKVEDGYDERSTYRRATLTMAPRRGLGSGPEPHCFLFCFSSMSVESHGPTAFQIFRFGAARNAVRVLGRPVVNRMAMVGFVFFGRNIEQHLFGGENKPTHTVRRKFRYAIARMARIVHPGAAVQEGALQPKMHRRNCQVKHLAYTSIPTLQLRTGRTGTAKGIRQV
jgi:hypothetical protein